MLTQWTTRSVVSKLVASSTNWEIAYLNLYDSRFKRMILWSLACLQGIVWVTFLWTLFIQFADTNIINTGVDTLVDAGEIDGSSAPALKDLTVQWTRASHTRISSMKMQQAWQEGTRYHKVRKEKNSTVLESSMEGVLWLSQDLESSRWRARIRKDILGGRDKQTKTKVWRGMMNSCAYKLLFVFPTQTAHILLSHSWDAMVQESERGVTGLSPS